ncbi:conserved hypothetical protein [Verticillium alfalfae VaMs.102]|uniref:Uncharacterized protein n=1 Tax=Verticillium alfalfae (strain VaMs.102 / ATCC MYA-4576 / FGSC 10136) TaxID=526221 RepID=C9SBH8_VERA1|nr:conserved hypothetical protein [Verticillium alfalfae VaMs.102]EEY15712.1 conserved hypothetical protein [Verticillium alfalfae VaMs.102]
MSDSADTLEEPFLASNAQLRPQQSIRHVSANNGSTAVAVFTTGPVNLPNAVHPQGTSTSGKNITA